MLHRHGQLVLSLLALSSVSSSFKFPEHFLFARQLTGALTTGTSSASIDIVGLAADPSNTGTGSGSVTASSASASGGSLSASSTTSPTISQTTTSNTITTSRSTTSATPSQTTPITTSSTLSRTTSDLASSTRVSSTSASSSTTESSSSITSAPSSSSTDLATVVKTITYTQNGKLTSSTATGAAATSTAIPGLADGGSTGASVITDTTKKIIGGVVGAVGGTLLIGGIAFVVWRIMRNKRRHQQIAQDDAAEYFGSSAESIKNGGDGWGKSSLTNKDAEPLDRYKTATSPGTNGKSNVASNF